MGDELVSLCGNMIGFYIGMKMRGAKRDSNVIVEERRGLAEFFSIMGWKASRSAGASAARDC